MARWAIQFGAERWPLAGYVLDLFAGCGGFALGAGLAGFETLAAVDSDSDLTSSIFLNFPTTKRIIADLAEVDARQIVALDPGQRLDGVIGGPPCQGFSEIGRRKQNDPRNQLVWHFFRHVIALRPRFFVMENVPGLLFSAHRPAFEGAIEQVERDYDLVGPFEVDAASFGAPTRRRRILVVGFARSEAIRITAEELASPVQARLTTVEEAIRDLEGGGPLDADARGFDWWRYSRPAQSPFAKKARALPPKELGSPRAIAKLMQGAVSGQRRTAHSPEVSRRFASLAQGAIDVVGRHPRLAWDGLCPTLRAGTGKDRGKYQSVRPIHPDQDRVITVREAARLQGFPDWFLFHPTVWHSFRMIGNSISPILAETVLSNIAHVLGYSKAEAA